MEVEFNNENLRVVKNGMQFAKNGENVFTWTESLMNAEKYRENKLT